MSSGAGTGAGFRELANLLACAAGVGCAGYLYPMLVAAPAERPGERILGLALTTVTCWLAVSGTPGGENDGIRLWIDRFFTAVGLSLVALYGMAYLLAIRPTPWPIVGGGCVLSLILVALLQRLGERVSAGRTGAVLVVGFDSTAAALARELGPRMVGVLEDDPSRVPADLPVLGGLAQLEDAITEKRPGSILVNQRCPRIPFQRLIRLRYAGTPVETAAALYEDRFCRINWEDLDPLDFLFSTSSGESRAAMAFQAVYTNVIGLSLLLLLSPVLIVTAVVVGVLSGGAPLEQVACLGFQRIPFDMLRFRVRRAGGELSMAGRVISRLRLVNLPQLINVVRGEMTLFGPPPARRCFAERLSQIIPIYAYRFAVKPGMLGWSQVNLRGSGAQDEALRLEYDLYYVKQESPSLDLDIFLRTILRMPHRH